MRTHQAAQHKQSSKRYGSRAVSQPLLLMLVSAMLPGLAAPTVLAQPRSPLQRRVQPFSSAEWDQVDSAVVRCVDWIAKSQQHDGSLPTLPTGQPGITSLGVLAMMAQGEMPGEGKHGETISQAIDFVLSMQKQNGLIAFVGPNGPTVSHNVPHSMGQTAVYNHAISGLMLSEAYATTNTERSKEIQLAIERALAVTLSEQARPKQRSVDFGGWRYLDKFSSDDADLSIIGWQLKFLRSAKNAGFDVPDQAIDDAVGCVKRHFNRTRRSFSYTPGSPDCSRAMNGAGILALAHAGMHDTEEARLASEVMLGYTFAEYNRSKITNLDRYHYSLFQCTQAAYQLGDEYWEQFYPNVFRTLLANQNPNGSWAAEGDSHGDSKFGNVYTSSLVVLALSAHNQLLPIYQR